MDFGEFRMERAKPEHSGILYQLIQVSLDLSTD
jgi:hypothetical protein